MMKFLSLVLLQLLVSLVAVASFAVVPPVSSSSKPIRSASHLYAADGAPQYDKFDGVLQQAEKVAEGSFMLHVTLADPKQDIQLDYQPGHVLALEFEDKSGDLNDDAKRNGGWMRGPYTVSRSTKDSIDVLVRVVGKKSKAFSESPEGTPVRFGGKFKVPILEGVKKEDTKSVVLVSTGVGIGPCVGAIELAMEDDSFPPIALFASFRDPEDVVYDDYLSQMAKENPTKFQWHPIVTSESGRISSCEKNLERVCNFATPDSHYHMIGNGQLVNEWKAGLAQAGVPEDKVTVEQYFNHKAESDQDAINNIANAIAIACVVEA